MGKRSKSRELALQALYQYELSIIGKEELIEFKWLSDKKKKKMPSDILLFAKVLITGTIDNIAQVDEYIRNNLTNWKFEQISLVDLSILRFSVYSLLFLHDIPYEVTIDEAVDLAKRFASSDSFSFVNGILDAVRKQHDKGVLL